MHGSSPAGNTTTTTTPWAGAMPYLQGNGKNITGTMPAANTLYQNSGWSPNMQNIDNNWQGNLSNQLSNTYQQTGIGSALMGGLQNTNINPVTANISAPQVNAASQMNQMGAANPTSAISQLLSGQVSPAMTGAIGNEANAMYGQATQNLMQQVMPQLNEQAIGAGGYGGSRQGIAQGLALSNMQQNLAPSIAGMYTNANQTAQGLQGSTANNMGQIASQDSMANAANSLAAQQANANIAMQNNAQAIDQSHNNAMNGLLGSQISQAGINQGNQLYQTGMSLAQAPNSYNWGNLQNYSNIINGTASLGGSQTQPYFQNQAANLGSLGLMGALGYAAIAASDRRLKKHIAKIGELMKGLYLYRFKYKSGGGWQVGVMADEVKKILPNAVITFPDGYDRVDYSQVLRALQ